MRPPIVETYVRKGKKVIDRGQTFSGACGGGCLDVGPWE